MPASVDSPRVYMTGHQRQILDWAQQRRRSFTAGQAASASGYIDAVHAAEELRSLVVGRFFELDDTTDPPVYRLADRGRRT